MTNLHNSALSDNWVRAIASFSDNWVRAIAIHLAYEGSCDRAFDHLLEALKRSGASSELINTVTQDYIDTLVRELRENQNKEWD